MWPSNSWTLFSSTNIHDVPILGQDDPNSWCVFYVGNGWNESDGMGLGWLGSFPHWIMDGLWWNWIMDYGWDWTIIHNPNPHELSIFQWLWLGLGLWIGILIHHDYYTTTSDIQSSDDWDHSRTFPFVRKTHQNLNVQFFMIWVCLKMLGIFPMK